jgi:Fe-S cluster biogenesis protein NfuA/nitrite reductase/ring-hydroxylating ferredoxin subunit
MPATTTREGHDELLLRVQDLQARLDSSGDAATRELAEDLVAAVVQMYGAGLERIVGSLLEAGEEGERLAAALAQEELVVPLLLIHDLHPVPLRERVQGALEHVRPYMESHGGDVELLSLQDGVARISLRGSCSDCAASAVTLELAIKQALEEAAPDLASLEVEGVAPAPAGPSLPILDGGFAPASPVSGTLELPIVMSSPTASAPSPPAPGQSPPVPVLVPVPSWVEVDHLDLVPVGQMVGAEVAGEELLVANVDGTLLAYANTCADCGGPLDHGELQAGALACPRCSRTFFLPGAGRSMDDERLQLQPIPLLREQGRVKVAVTL